MEKKTGDVLIAMKHYDDAKKALSLTDDAAVVIGEMTIDVSDDIKECIEGILKERYRNACKEYYDALDKLKEAVWEEYMNSFTGWY